MKLSHLLTAAAGAALVAGAAQAQVPAPVQTQTHSPPQAGPDRTTAADTRREHAGACGDRHRRHRAGVRLDHHL